MFFRNPDLNPDLLGEDGRPISFLKKANRRKIFEYVYEGSWWVNIDSIEAETAKLLGAVTRAQSFLNLSNT